jgi:hypothetical protein
MTPKEFCTFAKERGLWKSCEEIVKDNHCTMPEVFAKCGPARVRVARRDIWVFLRARGMSYPEIGDIFNRDHTTVLHTLNPDRRRVKTTSAAKRKRSKPA